MDHSINRSVYDIKFKQFKLDNGLHILLADNKNIPYFALNLTYHVGSKNEEPGMRGFAHLFEHLMFTGSKHCKDTDYDMYCNMAGGDNSAYTTEDKTSYILMLPSNQLELALWLESDRMLEFAVTKKNLDIQRDVVLEEKSQNYDNKPYGTAALEISKRLFNNCYSWTPIGDEADLKSTDLMKAKKFFENYYVPSNAVLSISGDLDIDETIKLAENYFGNIKSNSHNHFEFNDNVLNNEIRDVIYDNVQLPGIFISYKIPGETDDDFYLLNTLAYMISDGESSPLYKKLIYEDQIAFEADCFSEGFEYSGIFSAYAIMQPGFKPENAENLIDNIIEDIKIGNFDMNSVQKAINKIETRFFQRRQSNSAISDLLSHFYIIHNDPGLINEIINKYYEITKEKLIQTANKYFNKNNRVVLYYLPKKL